MELGPINRQMLIDYLLGTIPETDQLTLAEHLLTDEELSDRLLEVQADLVDRYVRGRLSPDEAQRLESYLDRLPGGRHKIVVAQALMKIAAEEHPPAAAKVQPSTWWRSMLLPVGRPKPLLAYSLLASLIALVTVVVWPVNHNERQNLEQMAAAGQKQPGEQPPEPGKSQQDSTSGVGEAPGTPAPVQAPRFARQPSPASKLAVLSLTPAMRSSPNPDSLTLRPNTRFVKLIAPLDRTQKYIEYRASIRTTTDHPILEEQAFHPLRNKNSIDIQLAASQVPSASYRLTLLLKTADAEEVSLDYYFNIVRR